MKRRPRPQASFRFSTEADPRYCASALCRASRQQRPTHTVTLGQHTFRVCATCARPYESIRGAKVAKIEEAIHA